MSKAVYVTLSQFCEDDERPRKMLEEAGFDVRQNSLGRRMGAHELGNALRETDAVIAAVEPYDANLLASLPRLRCISRCGVGTDTIDLEAARRLNIAVLTTADEVVEPVAQMTVAMILALARNLPQHYSEFRSGHWIKHTGFLISEWTIGLVGFGRIGRAVERILQAFGPSVVVADPYIEPKEVPGHVRLTTLDELLKLADVVSIHATRSAAEGPIIGRKEVALMKPKSRIVNTSRGHLLDESALRDALQSGHVVGAALDVFPEEPYRGPLSGFPQVLGTPHVATLTRASRVAMERRSALNVIEFFNSVASS